jgi:adenine-specific DNA-methyltransferase
MNINIEHERPVVFSDLLGRNHSEQTIIDHKKQYGQYLTPILVADFMGSLITRKNKEKITILDPGIGTGILTCAVCEKAIQKNQILKEINIIGYEVDKNIIPSTNKSLNYLSKWLETKNVSCKYRIIDDDYIISNADAFQEDALLFNNLKHEPKFDIIISNPPYFKINKNDIRSVAASRIVHGQPNIYSIFMVLSAYLLEEEGDLIFITPRSYTSGYYFKAFRETFFNEIIPQRFHLFGSRKEAFVRDDVLQEHLIIHGRKKNSTNLKSINKTLISFSNSSKDLNQLLTREALQKDVIDLSSNNKYVFLPLSDEEEGILSFVNSWNGNLHKFNMEISTGRVVPFRAIHLLHKEINKSTDYAPMIWMNHIKDNEIFWPFENWHKEQFITINDQSASLLVPNNNYILMRRFSPKEDLKRINTAPLIKNSLKFKFLGIENHVNYIHRPSGDLTLEEVHGLSAVLNSKYIDIYFRTLNGNTEVSATEIRDIPLPDYNIICSIGAEIIKKGIGSINVETILDSIKSGAA